MNLIPKDIIELTQLIEQEINQKGQQCDLNHIDVSLIGNMAGLFFNFKEFNGNISKWDVSKVINMSQMFDSSKFNGDISDWNVSSVKNMNLMFFHGEFKGDISKWKPASVKFSANMFSNCYAPIPYWYSNNGTEISEIIKKQEKSKELEKQLNNDLKIQMSLNKKLKV